MDDEDNQYGSNYKLDSVTLNGITLDPNDCITITDAGCLTSAQYVNPVFEINDEADTMRVKGSLVIEDKDTGEEVDVSEFIKTFPSALA